MRGGRPLGRAPVGARRPSGKPSIILGGVGNFNNVNFWRGAAGAGPGGTAAMTFACIFRNNGALNTDITLFQRWTSAVGGFRLRAIMGPVRESSTVVNGTPANVSETTGVTLVNGSVHRAVGRLSAGVLDIFLDGAQVGAPGPAVVGYTAAPAGATPDIGESVGAAINLTTICGVVMANATALSDAEIATWDGTVVATGEFRFPSGTTHLWDARDAIVSGAGTWTDQIAAVVLNEQGTVTQTLFSPIWA